MLNTVTLIVLTASSTPITIPAVPGVVSGERIVVTFLVVVVFGVVFKNVLSMLIVDLVGPVSVSKLVVFPVKL